MARSIYDTPQSKKVLSVDLHRTIKESVPNYLMVKATAGSVGCAPEGCRMLSRFVNVFAHESRWGELGPCGLRGCCSAMVYWNPPITLGLWQLLRAKRWDELRAALEPVQALHRFLAEHFGQAGFTDTAYDHLRGVATGFLPIPLRSQGPYRGATEEDVETLRAWCKEHFPELLELRVRRRKTRD